VSEIVSKLTADQQREFAEIIELKLRG